MGIVVCYWFSGYSKENQENARFFCTVQRHGTTGDPVVLALGKAAGKDVGDHGRKAATIPRRSIHLLPWLVVYLACPCI
jgi:hypothetical protein